MQTRELEENWAITKNVSHSASFVKVPLNSNSCKSLIFFFSFINMLFLFKKDLKHFYSIIIRKKQFYFIIIINFNIRSFNVY